MPTCLHSSITEEELSLRVHKSSEALLHRYTTQRNTHTANWVGMLVWIGASRTCLENDAT